MIMGEESARSYGCGDRVRERLHPWPGIFMRHDRSHGPSEHGVPAWKRGIQTGMLPEVSTAIALAWTLSCADKLHRRIHQECVDQGFQSDFTGFPSVRMISFDSIRPNPSDRAAHESDAAIRESAIEGGMTCWQSVVDITVLYE